jgi:hypothetical protein
MSWQTRELLVAVVATITLVWIVLWWCSTRTAQRQARQSAKPLTLWEKLCEAHHLSWSDSERLARLADTAGVANPLMLFVDPRVLENAAGSDPDASRLGLRLFGDAFQPAVVCGKHGPG